MKNRSILFFVALTFFTSTLIAQSQFGIKAGVNLSDIGYIPSGSTRPQQKTSFHAGVIIDARINKMAVIAPEVLISLKGANYKLVSTEGYSIDSAATLMYIQIPVSIKYQKEDKSGPVFGLGPYVSILGGARGKTTFKITSFDSLGVKTSSVDSTHITTGTDIYHPIDLGFHFTLGFKFKMGLFINARYEIGITNIVKERTITKADAATGQETSSTSLAYGRNTNIQFSIGWMFGGGKKSNYY